MASVLGLPVAYAQLRTYCAQNNSAGFYMNFPSDGVWSQVSSLLDPKTCLALKNKTFAHLSGFMSVLEDGRPVFKSKNHVAKAYCALAFVGENDSARKWREAHIIPRFEVDLRTRSVTLPHGDGNVTLFYSLFQHDDVTGLWVNRSTKDGRHEFTFSLTPIQYQNV